jgi:hypothetical protein
MPYSACPIGPSAPWLVSATSSRPQGMALASAQGGDSTDRDSAGHFPAVEGAALGVALEAGVRVDVDREQELLAGAALRWPGRGTGMGSRARQSLYGHEAMRVVEPG